ncbi:hypothetical protein [Pseudofulvibacter geojedonensis]|uniref:Uncharacterized protein n=1 Tax=Pseudofulvibacter geojedonensis TaxID=1123758 RepID=A0ABW3HZF3_9FLAO
MDTLKLSVFEKATDTIKFKEIVYLKEAVDSLSLHDLLVLECNKIESTMPLQADQEEQLMSALEQEMIKAVAKISYDLKKKKVKNKVDFNTNVLKELVKNYSKISLNNSNTAIVDLSKLQFRQEFRLGNNQIKCTLTPKKIFVKLLIGKYKNKTLYELVNEEEIQNLEEEVSIFLKSI